MPNAPQPLEIARGFHNGDPAWEHAIALLEAAGSTSVRGHGRTTTRTSTPLAARAWAASGAMSLTGEETGPPRFAAAPLAIAALGAGLAIETLTDGRVREADWAALLAERAALVGQTRRGRISSGGAARLLETRDDWIALQLPRRDDWQLVPAWLEIELATADFEHDSGWRRVAEHLRTRSRDDLLDRGRMMGLALADATRTIERDVPAYQISDSSESNPIARQVRVLDLTSLWAGPLATSLLSNAGCDVLKVESPTRPDGARSGSVDFFNLMNHGKRSIALDLHAPSDRVHFERLLEAADVVIESARPRALAQLGYDASAWCSARPGRIWTSITGYGRDHEWIAFGDDAAIAAGLAWDPDCDTADSPAPSPVFCGDAIADPLTGLHAAALMLGLLRKGRGGLLELALRDVVASTASIDAGPLVAQLEPDDRGGWIVRGGGETGGGNEGEVVAVAEPRARRIRGAAPRLAEPTEAALARWDGPPC